MSRIAAVQDRLVSAGKTKASGRRKVRVLLEGGESFVLPAGRAAGLGLREGEELPEVLHREILAEVRGSCMRKCGSLLECRDYSVRRMEEKLREAEYPESVIREAVEKLRKAGYLDDSRYAREFVRSHIRDKSRLRIRKDLLDRGIGEALIEQAFLEIGAQEDLDEAQREQIRRLLRRRGFDAAAATYEEKNKTMAFLYRKGFSAEIIRAAMESNMEPDLQPDV
ncbi:MAG: regulatory protein RecX [Eubacteriales bacterium]|nr:regulatory protein RecX [Eubacteriales bacterium]